MNTLRRYIGFISPDWNDGQHVFVFGSNLKGVHGAGAALTARRNWGAQNGVAVGRTGQAYAIPTKEHWRDQEGLSLVKIQCYVNDFLHIEVNQKLVFLVTPIGTGYAGYRHEDIAPMFKNAPPNVVLPEVWRQLLEDKL